MSPGLDFVQDGRVGWLGSSADGAVERCFGLPEGSATEDTGDGGLDGQPSPANQDDQRCQNDRADEVNGLSFGHSPIVGNYPSFQLHRPFFAAMSK